MVLKQDKHSIHSISPLLPPRDERLDDMAVTLIRESSSLGAHLAEMTKRAVGELVVNMNCYYSNLIEGHYTYPLDIEKAMAGEYSADPGKRELQTESVAHIEVQRLLGHRLSRGKLTDIFNPRYSQWIHEEFYGRLPDDMRILKDVDGDIKGAVVPGEFRDRDVRVGGHTAPSFGSVPVLMKHLWEAYGVGRTEQSQINQVLTAAAFHHRFLWVHPFPDGNGRVARLLTNAYLSKTGLDSGGIWTPVRGFSRNNQAYKEALASADMPRMGDYDGRGALSEKGLIRFCEFFITTCIDQIRFMADLLQMDGLEKRIQSYVQFRAGARSLRPEAFRILKEVLIHGELSRGDALISTGLPERTARNILSQLHTEGLVRSHTPKSRIMIAFPYEVCPYYFPKLFLTRENDLQMDTTNKEAQWVSGPGR